MSVLQDIHKLSPGTLITFYELDLSPCQGKFGQTTTDVLRWVDGANELDQDIVWQGKPYYRYPIKATGFEKQGNGTIPRPKLSVSNINSSISVLNREYMDLAGAKLKRIRTFLRYLDAVNFEMGNQFADPTQILDSEVWIIDRKASENSIYVEWELTAPFDTTNLKLPKRQCIQNACLWQYRGTECGYKGTQYYNQFDEPTTSSQDKCGKRLSSCKLRFGKTAILPYGGFPGVGYIG